MAVVFAVAVLLLASGGLSWLWHKSRLATNRL